MRRVDAKKWDIDEFPFSKKPFLVFLTGAGMSAESGLKTFRGEDGLWKGHDVTKVASPVAWKNNRELVLEFYNLRRKQLGEVEPNLGHKIIAKLEEKYDVLVITQNVDDLHERGGSSHVLHLHGELTQVRSTYNPKLIYDIEYSKLNIGDKCEYNSQLRPNIVWFGEAVPNISVAMEFVRRADVLVVVGTSLVVYPAADLIYETKPLCKKILIDPNTPGHISSFHVIEKTAVDGMKELWKDLCQD